MASSSSSTTLILIVAIVLIAGLYYLYTLITALGVHTTTTQSLIDQKIISPNGICFSTSTGTGTSVQATLKDYWEDTYTTDFKYNNVTVIAGVQFKLTRIGKQVTLIQTTPYATTAGIGLLPGGYNFVATASFPDRYKPADMFIFPTLVLVNNVKRWGATFVVPNTGTTTSTGGYLQITGADSFEFASGSSGWYTVNGSWNVV